MTRPNDDPLVSIIMNCYNGEKYLRQAIESVLAQSYQNWEVIFWDNQSVDNSANIFKSYKDPRLHYHYAEKSSALYEARNNALLECQGDLIAILDVDDWWFPEKLQIQVPLFKDNDVGMSCGNYVLVNERKSSARTLRVAYPLLPFGDVLDDLLDDYFVHFSTFVARKKSLNDLTHLFDTRFHIIADFDLVIRLSVKWKLASVQQPIAYYRWHQNNTGYKADFLISDDLNLWYEQARDNPIYRGQKHFFQIERKVRLYDVLKMLYIGDRLGAYRRIKTLPNHKKIKAFIAIILPLGMVRKWMKRS